MRENYETINSSWSLRELNGFVNVYELGCRYKEDGSVQVEAVVDGEGGKGLTTWVLTAAEVDTKNFSVVFQANDGAFKTVALSTKAWSDLQRVAGYLQ